MKKILGIELGSTRIKSVLIDEETNVMKMHIYSAFTYLGEQKFENFLDGIFENVEKTTISASESEINSFNTFMTKYKKALSVERLASEVL